MFFNKKNKDKSIGSPLIGRCISTKKIADPVFAEDMVGRGVAIIPSEGKIFAPFDGKISVLFPTLHAIAITSNDGIELLIHVGMNTVSLEGKAFKAYCKEGDKVKKGTLLIEFDIDMIKDNNLEIITPVVITNHNIFSEFKTKTDIDVNISDEIIVVSK